MAVVAIDAVTLNGGLDRGTLVSICDHFLMRKDLTYAEKKI